MTTDPNCWDGWDDMDLIDLAYFVVISLRRVCGCEWNDQKYYGWIDWLKRKKEIEQIN